MTKGEKYEKELSKRLSLWVTENERDDVFEITQGSKSDHPIANKLETVFYINCKFHDDINIWSIIIKPTTNNFLNIYESWIDTINSSYKKEPMLIIKQKYKPELLIIDSKFERFTKPMGLIPLFKFYINSEDEAAVYDLKDVLQIKSERLDEFLTIVKNLLEISNG